MFITRIPSLQYCVSVCCCLTENLWKDYPFNTASCMVACLHKLLLNKLQFCCTILKILLNLPTWQICYVNIDKYLCEVPTCCVLMYSCTHSHCIMSPYSLREVLHMLRSFLYKNVICFVCFTAVDDCINLSCTSIAVYFTDTFLLTVL